ncbi:MAG: hypothetical protein AAF529_16045 [Pseudomonadota bacterium]
MTAATLKFLIKGVPTSREQKGDLRRELLDMLPNANAVVVLEVVQGYAVDIELSDLAPFSRTSIEPYLAEHVLPDAVRVCCGVSDAEMQLLKASF